MVKRYIEVSLNENVQCNYSLPAYGYAASFFVLVFQVDLQDVICRAGVPQIRQLLIISKFVQLQLTECSSLSLWESDIVPLLLNIVG